MHPTVNTTLNDESFFTIAFLLLFFVQQYMHDLIISGTTRLKMHYPTILFFAVCRISNLFIK